MLDHIDHLLCRTCGSTFRPSVRSLCPQCVDGGELRYVYDLSRVALDAVKLSRRESWLWRFKELLPFDEAVELPPLQVGMTPLYGSPRLAAYAGLGGLIVKDESRNPTGRLGSRGGAVGRLRPGSIRRPSSAGDWRDRSPPSPPPPASPPWPCVARRDPLGGRGALRSRGGGAHPPGSELLPR